MSRRDIATDFIRSAMASVESSGFDLRRALREGGLPPGLLAQDAPTLPAEHAVALMRVLWRLTDDELLGLGPTRVPRGSFRMISLGLIHCADLGAALTRMVEFVDISAGYRRSRLLEHEGVARLEFGGGPQASIVPLATEIMLAFAHRFSSWLIGQRITLSAVALPFAEPSYSDEYEVIFGVLPRFDASVPALEFDGKYLSAPLVRDEPALLDFVRHSPADIIVRRDYGTTMTDRVRKILERSGAERWDLAEDVAARLAISAQHMRRLLKDEGSSFRKIREDFLRDEALASLRKGRESVDELSQRLGFSEPSAFRRAFTRWTGTSPSEYRSRQLRGDA